MKALAEKYSTQTIALGLVAAFIWLQSRVQSILPAVMQDEYIYSMQARKVPLAELDYPNYLYSLVFSSTNACGINFYSCAKNLNLVFFAGFVAIIFLLTLSFLGKWWAFGLSIATLLSPLGAYTSLFMPESMYFFFALIAVVALWWASWKSVWWHYLLAGVAIGLTSLVKPHALFLAGGAALFLLLVFWRKWREFAISLGSYVLGTLGTKFLVGFLIAGPSGLTFFGSSYTSSLNVFTDNLQGSGLPEGLSASSEFLMAEGEAQSNPLVEFLGMAIYQFGWQSAAVLLIAGALISVVVGALRVAVSTGTNATEMQEQKARRFAQLVLISLGSMVLVIAAFAAMVSLLGDDHSNRLLLRYYEFLIAPLAIAALTLAKQNPKGNWVMWVSAGLSAAIGAVSFWGWFPGLRALFADSPIMMGITSSEFAGGVAVTLALAAGGAVFLNSKTRLMALGSLTIFSLVFFGFSSVNRLHAQASTISEVDSAGIFARDYLAAADPNTILFVGTNRQLTLASIFSLDKPGVAHRLVNPFEKLSLDQVPEGTEWIMTFGGVRVDVTPRFVVNGQGWSLLNVSNVNKHYFSQNMQNTDVASVSGLGPITNWGQWVASSSAEIQFKQPLAAGTQMALEIMVTPAGAGQRIEMRLGDGVTYVDLPEAGTIATVTLDFKNTTSSDVIEIITPGGLTEAFVLVSIQDLN